MATVHVTHDFSAPVERVFDYLSEHENLGILFSPMRVERAGDGDTERNGVGSARKLSLGGIAPFVETVTAVVPNERIEYKITKGSPLRHHYAVMAFAASPAGGTHLDYTITLEAPVPGMASAIAAILRSRISGGLERADAQL